MHFDKIKTGSCGKHTIGGLQTQHGVLANTPRYITPFQGNQYHSPKEIGISLPQKAHNPFIFLTFAKENKEGFKDKT